LIEGGWDVLRHLLHSEAQFWADVDEVTGISDFMRGSVRPAPVSVIDSPAIVDAFSQPITFTSRMGGR